MNSELRKKISQIYHKILDTTSNSSKHNSAKKSSEGSLDSKYSGPSAPPSAMTKKSRY